MRRRSEHAFTLVELLVVIGIIALLISVLLPALNKARAAAQTAACLSNVRQMVIASMLQAQDHKGFIQTCTSDSSNPGWLVIKYQDPEKQKFTYRSDNLLLMDVYSALLPYLGSKSGATFQTDANLKGKVFRCPSDKWLDAGPEGQSGYRIFNNVTNLPNGPNFPISYGVNADISCVSDSSGVGRFDLSNSVAVADGPVPVAPFSSMNPDGRKMGQPLQAKLAKVHKPSEVLLFADCGTRPVQPNLTAPLDYNDALYYTTNYMYNSGGVPSADAGRLSGTMLKSWLKDRVPLDRHGGKRTGSAPSQVRDGRVNIGFCDGHAETVLQSDLQKVRISPY